MIEKIWKITKVENGFISEMKNCEPLDSCKERKSLLHVFKTEDSLFDFMRAELVRAFVADEEEEEDDEL